MAVLWFGAAVTLQYLETGGNQKLDAQGVTQTVTGTSPGGNLEGKDLRFGAASSALWGSSTTGTSNGSVNSMHDSYTPAGGLVAHGQHEARRDEPGRCRRRAQRAARDGDPRRVHRRPDGRTNTGVPGQEDPGVRREAGRHLHPGDAGGRARLHRRIRVRGLGEGRVDLQPRRPRLQRAAVRVHVGRRTTTARPSPASPPTPRG